MPSVSALFLGFRLGAARVVLSLSVAAGFSACGSISASEPSESNGSCSDKEASPLSVSVVRDALRARGFHVDVARDPVCGAFTVAELSNVEDAEGEQYEQVLDDEGHLSCNIESDVINTDSPLTIVDIKRIDGELRSADAIYELANVNCSLYTSAASKPRVQQLQDALEDLSRELGPE